MAQTNNTEAIASAHFIGIGGAGMSGIALVLHERGCKVSGSDLKKSHYVRDLRKAGIEVRLGQHEAQTIDDVMPEVVVISSAIPDTNAELMRARELGIDVWPRAKMLAYLGIGATEIAVAGTHGKTTTSSMIASMVDHLGMDPSFLIGGVVEEYGTNGRDGRGGYFVCEADESDGSFLYLDPDVAVVTNIEEDHLDHYGTLENIERTFCEFMDLVGDEGTVVIWGDVAHNVELARSTGRRVVTYGMGADNDYVCEPLHDAPKKHRLENHCRIHTPSGQTVSVVLMANPGDHNLLNATASIAVAEVLGCDAEAAAEALSLFRGAHRRFTHVGDVAGITVVDDYGHHPTEIKATLAAARGCGFERIVQVFQPHRYTRTEKLMDEFATAFDQADLVVVTPVFSAGEMPIPGVSGRVLAHRMEELGDVEVHSIERRKDVIDYLCDTCRSGDLLITQGAGDVTSIGPDFITAMHEREEA